MKWGRLELIRMIVDDNRDNNYNMLSFVRGNDIADPHTDGSLEMLHPLLESPGPPFCGRGLPAPGVAG